MLNQEIELKAVCTSDEIVDIFTKTLTKAKFEKFRVAFRIIDHKYGLRESITN